jgi:hypothetical protein
MLENKLGKSRDMGEVIPGISARSLVKIPARTCFLLIILGDANCARINCHCFFPECTRKVSDTGGHPRGGDTEPVQDVPPRNLMAWGARFKRNYMV